MKYPALQLDASRSSDAAQRRFLWLVRAEYILLLLTSIGYVLLPPIAGSHIALMVMILGALSATGYRAWKKPDEDWYQFRALAESVKTLAWRYAMRAEPFNQDDAASRAEYRNALRELLHVNATLGPKFEDYKPDADQITADMSAARASSLSDRKTAYLALRIRNQRGWYAKKASTNKNTGRSWQMGLAVVYTSILLILGTRIALPDWSIISPDPLLVAASSIVGWMQVKKFNDLAAAYLLTAQEIGIAETEIDEIATEEPWSRFVNACEQVFSREHTQWVARRAS